MAHDDSDKDSGGEPAIQTTSLADLEAVAFDLDSTLCYYPLSVEEVFREAFARAGMAPDVLGPVSDAAARYATLWGEVQATLESTERIRLHIIERLLADRGSHDPALAARLSEAYGAVRDETGIVPYDDVAALLDDLRTRYRLGLLTNGPSDMQWEKIRSLGFGAAFDAVVVAGDVGIYKPDPRVFAMLVDRLGTRPEATLFVGDSYPLDIVGAHRAGLRTAWVRKDGATPPDEIAADIEIPDASSLRGVLP